MNYSRSSVLVILIFCFLIGVGWLSFAKNVGSHDNISILPNNDYLSSIIDSLLNTPKYKCIFHDSFARGDFGDSINDNDGNKYICYASNSELGNNNYSVLLNEGLSYNTIGTANSSVQVGIKRIGKEDGELEYVAINNKEKGTKQKILKMIDVGCSFYDLSIKKGPSIHNVAKVAFWIKDINNFYFVRHSNKRLELYKVTEGKKRCLASFRKITGRYLNVELSEGKITLKSKGVFLRTINVNEKEYGSLCGLFFTSDEVTEISSWAVYKTIFFKAYPLKLEEEKSGIIKGKGKYYHVEAEENTISLQDDAIRFLLNYETDYLSHIVSNSRRSEISLLADDAPLDSWIVSFNVLFPDISSQEFFEKDVNYEIIFQTHDRYAGPGLSPQFAIRVVNDEIICTIRSREVLVWNKEGTINKKFILAKLIDNGNIPNNDGVLYLKKGEWNSFIVYVKEGYLPEHNPKTIVFINGIRVLNDISPNAYNAGSFGSFIKLGIYKPLWKTDKLESTVRRRVLYMSDIHYYR